MDAYSRVMILLIALSFLTVMWVNFWVKKAREARQMRTNILKIPKIEPVVSSSVNQPAVAQAASNKSLDENLLILSVIAKPNDHFASYDLLQAISSVGMQFGA